MNASNIKGNPLAFMPAEVIQAALILAAYQEKTGNQINFGTLGPSPASRFIPASPQQVYVKIENVSRKTVRKIVRECEGLELAHFNRDYPSIWFRDYPVGNAAIILEINGDREKNTKEAIARTAERDGKAAAEYVASQLMKQYSLEGDE